MWAWAQTSDTHRVNHLRPAAHLESASGFPSPQPGRHLRGSDLPAWPPALPHLGPRWTECLRPCPLCFSEVRWWHQKRATPCRGRPGGQVPQGRRQLSAGVPRPPLTFGPWSLALSVLLLPKTHTDSLPTPHRTRVLEAGGLPGHVRGAFAALSPCAWQ